jgi:hypothetical protein
MARDGLLHLQRGVFGHQQVARHQRCDAAATRLPQHQGRLRVDVHEGDLDRGHIGLVAGVDFADAVVDDFQAGGQVAHLALGGLDHAAGHVLQFGAGHVEHTKAGGLQAGVNAQDADGGGGVGHHGRATSFMRLTITSAREAR